MLALNRSHGSASRGEAGPGWGWEGVADGTGGKDWREDRPQMEQAGGGAGRRDVDPRAGERPLLSSQTPEMLWASVRHPC